MMQCDHEMLFIFMRVKKSILFKQPLAQCRVSNSPLGLPGGSSLSPAGGNLLSTPTEANEESGTVDVAP